MDLSCTVLKGLGEDGNDIGEDNRNGDVGVERLEGNDNLDSDVTNDLSGIFACSVGSRTVGRDILSAPFFVDVDSSVCGLSMLIWKEKYERVRHTFKINH